MGEYMRDYDFLVIGSGIAGLVFALKISELGSVAIITKDKIHTSNTEYAQGGIAAVLNKHDSFESHVNDTYIAGSELGKKEVIKKIVQEAPSKIKYLMNLGTEFTTKGKNIDRDLENLSLTQEGGHSKKRIVYAADSTGLKIMEALVAACQNKENIDIYENFLAIDLITQHHLPQKKGFIPRIRCWGAYVLDVKTGEVHTFRTRKTMLATGGGSQVYANNTNPQISTGDGYAMARLAGARLANMEFVQFHPTAFYEPEGKGFLISEALRGEGAILKLKNGSTFMEKYHEKECLAPRDIVSRAIEYEIRKSGEKYVYLDATNVGKEKLKKHFPYIDGKLQEHNIDFTCEPIPVVPAAHYFCGGILSTVEGVTDIKNLYAAGETACTGFHGANRLASNSLLEALVVAYKAAEHPSNKKDTYFPEIPPWKIAGNFNENEWVIISHNKEIIKKIMQGYVGIIRSKKLLEYALNRINNIYKEINNFYKSNPVRQEVIETRNLSISALAIISSALNRKESRGLHYIKDYPNRDDDNFKKDTIL